MTPHPPDNRLLWIPSWYPVPEDPYNGDFIQRHAEAVSTRFPLTVMYIRRSAGLPPGGVDRQVVHREGLTEVLIGYNVQGARFPALERLRSERRYRKLLREEIERYLREQGRPRLIHLHVNGRPGPVVVQAARKYRLPLFLTEHWSAFLPEGVPSWRTLNGYTRYRIRRTWRAACALSAVSAHLARSLEGHTGKKCAVIPNVVNLQKFYYAGPPAEGVFRIVHISGLDGNKNWQAILQAAALAGKAGLPLQLEVFGPAGDIHFREAERLGILPFVQFRGVQPPAALSAALQLAHGLILYSNFETFGCVLIEALACGTPVVVSDLPAFRDIVEEGVNGLTVLGNGPQALADTIIKLAGLSEGIDRKAIARQAAQMFGYAPVAEQFSNWYRQELPDSAPC